METSQTNGKEWANPTAAGLVGLAVACVCFFALLSGRVSAGALPLIGCWLLGAFVIQLIVAFVDLKSGNLAGGNTFLYFSCFFLFANGIAMLLKYNAIMAENPLEGKIDGYVWITLAIVTWLWTPAFCVKFNLLSIIVILLDIALPFIGLVDLGALPKTFAVIPAWTLLIDAVVAVYLASAIVVNGTYKKKIYPQP